MCPWSVSHFGNFVPFRHWRSPLPPASYGVGEKRVARCFQFRNGGLFGDLFKKIAQRPEPGCTPELLHAAVAALLSTTSAIGLLSIMRKEDAETPEETAM